MIWFEIPFPASGLVRCAHFRRVAPEQAGIVIVDVVAVHFQ